MREKDIEIEIERWRERLYNEEGGRREGRKRGQGEEKRGVRGEKGSEGERKDKGELGRVRGESRRER